MPDIEEQIKKWGDKPRSERVLRLFGHPEWDADPWLPDYQKELLDYVEDRDKAEAAVKPGRQVGKTMVGALIAADYALMHENADILIAAPFQETADEMFRETKQYFKSGPFDLEQYGVINDNKTTWEFVGNTRILSRTLGDISSENPGQRGKNPECVVVDEAHFAKDAHFTDMIEPFFITHPSYEYYLFSTPQGKSGYFYEKVVNDDSWYSPHWPTEISPFAQQEFIDRKREELDSTTFAQEYLGEFVDTGDALFSVSDVKQLPTPEPLTGDRYLGVDVAREGKDRTVYTEIDEHGNVRIADSEDTSTVDGVLGRIKDLHRENKYSTIIVEENSMGGGVVDFGQYDLSDVIQPFKSSTKSKHQLYKRLQKDIENNDLALPEHRRLIDELTSLKYEFTQHGYMKTSHPDGGHDDFPDSLAFANWGRTNGGVNVTRRTANVSSGSVI